MATIRVPVQVGEAGDQLSPDRVEMNVPNQFQQIHFLLAKYGLVAILKKTAVAAVAMIESHCVTGE
jgi:hypothetical protein